MPAISFEFFPPKTDEQRAQMDRAAQLLKTYRPEYASVTFGAGGSTLSYTSETVRHLHGVHGLAVAPHLSCVGGTRAELGALLDDYRAAGYRRIVALRGDLPSGMATPGDFRYAAELVAFIREHSGDHFHIEVAAYPETHPQADNALHDLHHFKAKVDAGADGAITQYFFNADAYFRFIDDARKLGVTVPIVPGIMPIANYSQLKRFSDMCGAEIPRWIAKRMQAHGDDADSVRALGAEVVAQLCRRLLDGGAPGLHFYTLNRARATQAVLQQLD
jgi:methylenetetrahydrofolate reductase (NADPH)